jgi:glycosyltransferase involved in cell wall biosynthesis
MAQYAWHTGKVHDAVMAHQAQSGPVSVVFLAGQFFPLQGGAEVATLREAKALRARGHDIRVLTLRLRADWPRTDVVEGIPVHRIGGLFVRGKLRTRFGAKWLPEALLWLELVRTRRTYAVMHLRHLGVMTRPALLAALMTGKPVIARISGRGPDAPARHGQPLRLYAGDLNSDAPFLVTHDMPRNGDIEDLRHANWLGDLTLRLLRQRLVTFVATSTRIRADLMHLGYRSERIQVLPSAVDAGAYQETALQVRAHAAHDSEPIVVCVAHLRYEKGLDILLHAWQTVHAYMPAARLVLAGHGPLEPQLRSMAMALDVSEHVQFAGMIHDVRSMLAKGDVFVLPSRHEGLPNALLEAMASGLPCIATRVSGSEDVIVDGFSGLLVPPEDPGALASALLALLGDRQRARAMGEAGRQRIIGAFNQVELTERLERLYAAATTSGGGGHEPRRPVQARISMPTLMERSARHPEGREYHQ